MDENEKEVMFMEAFSSAEKSHRSIHRLSNNHSTLTLNMSSKYPFLLAFLLRERARKHHGKSTPGQATAEDVST